MKKLLAALMLLAAPAFAQDGPAPGSAAVEDGRQVYNRNCTACHGVNGTAGEMAPALGQTGRRYNRHSDAEIFDAVKTGIAGTAMPGFARKLPDAQIRQVVAYVKGLRGTAMDAPPPGDVAQGEAVFWGKGHCGDCHMINGRGSVIGPELSSLGAQRKLNSIIAALTRPDHRVYGDGGAIPHTLMPLATHQSVRVTADNGAVTQGILRNEDSYALQVMGMDGQLHLFDRAKIRVVDYLPGSIMPSDYDKRLAPGEFADLVAFLSRLAPVREPVTAPLRLGDPD